MKRLLLTGLCVAALAACTDEAQKANQKLTQERDSLVLIVEQKDSELNDILFTMNEIEDGMRKIGEAEGRVTIAKQGEGASQKARIQENMAFIQKTLKENKELVEKLKSQLKNSTFKGEQLQKAIDNLTVQIAEKDKEIQTLRAELVAKDIHIVALDEKIEDLNTNVTELKTESTEKTEVIKEQDKQIHTAWFVFGTKSELKAQKILVDGKVLEGNFNRSYFTEIDIRNDKEIKLYSKSAELLTSHPASSYALARDANKQYTLRINNPELFWSTSKYLVIQVK